MEVLRIVTNRDKTLASMIAEESDIERVSIAQRKQIVELLLDELGEHGLDSDGEPNEYGKRVELLADVVNQSILREADNSG